MVYLSTADLHKLLQKLSVKYSVFVPVKKDNQRFYQQYTDANQDIVIGEVRAFEPLKSFFFRAREVVAENFSSQNPNAEQRPLCLVGVKACDLKGFQTQDFVFDNPDYQDPFYIRNRQNNLIISADCTQSIETCFCTALSLKPYPNKNFDLNLTEVKDGFIIESGSNKGKALLDENSDLFSEAAPALLESRDALRAKVTDQVEKQVKTANMPEDKLLDNAVERNFSSSIWEEVAKTCVECGACNVICPTCHCFLLYDQKNEEKMARLKIWDSCLIKDFATVAGGANPRPKLWMRLRNRFEKKFDYFPKVAKTFACTGCGRCISACPGKIDIRRILKNISE